ncbi:MAG: ptpA 2, partial [Verrucomicrobiaceae bacterium]|nr:ptpA 2 [Verrucomicrobiaceae bacterium]
LGPHASSPTGEPTQVRFVNQLRDDVECFWITAEGRPKSYGWIKPGAAFAQNTLAGHVWLLKDRSGEPLCAFEARVDDMEVVIDGKGRPSPKPAGNSVSPDGRHTAFIRQANVHLQDSNEALTSDGGPDDAYRGIHWSPDSQKFVSVRVRKGQEHKVTFVESSPADQIQPRLVVHDYLKAGDALPAPRPVLFDAATGKATLIDNALFPNFFSQEGRLDIRWAPASDEFFFDYNQRGHQLYRIIGVNARTGTARVVVEETCKNFIDYTHKTWGQLLD